MEFKEYLKRCREKHGLTQEKLVQELYFFDDRFENLDMVTLSRWERGVTQPGIERETLIIRFFRRYEDAVIPCMKNSESEDVEKEFCAIAIRNLLGKNRRLILNFPAGVVQFDDLKTSHVRHAEEIDRLLDIPHRLIDGMAAEHVHMEKEKLKALALYPENLFLYTTFKEEFFGLLFTIRVKKTVFDELMDFRKRPDEIAFEDFAKEGEKGCSYVHAFFAYDDKSATHLFLRYYAHLIANQNLIAEVGAVTGSDGAGKLASRLYLKKASEKEVGGSRLVSYRAPLEDVLINENVIKMFFKKQRCPQEM